MDIGGYKVIVSRETKDTKVEVLSFDQLRGSSDIRTAEKLFYAQNTGMTLKMVKISLIKSSVRVEPGALYYMKGDLEMKASTGGGVFKGLKRKMLSGESFFVNEIHGTGEIFLEPTFGHFFLHSLQNNETGIIVDSGLFYGGTEGLDIDAVMLKTFSSAVASQEGLFQTRIRGTGIAIMYSPVPEEEIEKFSLDDDRLFVDGNFTLMRSGSIKYKVVKSSKSLLATSVSGEGLLHRFEGTGNVWIAPTQGIYEKMSTDVGLKSLSRVPGSRNTETTTTRK
ncbi:MAG: AIM24 family protein [Clostridia bacterium]|nr:AIM24 family protein [Clostridia bacterium]